MAASPSPAGPTLLGIVNITEDSFSDGGRYLAAEAATAHAERLAADGAAIIDLGAASSRPEARPVSAPVEIARLAPVVEALTQRGIAVSVDSFGIETQRWALAQGVAFLNDVRGFPDPALYPALAQSTARLIVMHSVEGLGPATRVDLPADAVLAHIDRFFETRLAALEGAGVARDRVILDPGMGFFLGRRLEASLRVLDGLGALGRRFGLPVLVSVSRKSFLRHIAGRPVEQVGPATLAAELAAAAAGADFIRTHEPGPLKDGLAVWQALGRLRGPDR